MTTSLAPMPETFERENVLDVEPLHTHLGRLPDRLLVVQDPQLGGVPVRWRMAPALGGWIWRCSACQTRTRTAGCAHTFAAALVLAQDLLGLTSPIPARLTQKEIQTA